MIANINNISSENAFSTYPLDFLSEEFMKSSLSTLFEQCNVTVLYWLKTNN